MAIVQQNWCAAARVRLLPIPIGAAIGPALEGSMVLCRCIKGVPPDANVEKLLIVDQAHFGVIFSHPSWKLISLGGMIPLIEVQLENMTPNAIGPVMTVPGTDAPADTSTEAPADQESAPAPLPFPARKKDRGGPVLIG